jgi:hypothetical protein
VIEVVERLALAPPPAPRALPLINDDIHLTCWMAIVPETPPTIAEQTGEFPLGDKL